MDGLSNGLQDGDKMADLSQTVLPVVRYDAYTRADTHTHTRTHTYTINTHTRTRTPTNAIFENATRCKQSRLTILVSKDSMETPLYILAIGIVRGAYKDSNAFRV